MAIGLGTAPPLLGVAVLVSGFVLALPVFADPRTFADAAASFRTKSDLVVCAGFVARPFFAAVFFAAPFVAFFNLARLRTP